MKNPTLRRVRSRLTYSNLIATLALFIALGGVSYAAVKLPKNSVTSKTIKAGAVTSPKIKNKTITASDIKDNAISGSQIDEASLTVAPPAFVATAGTAADSINFAKSVRSSASDADEDLARANATAIPIASHGSVSIYAKCFTTTGDSEIHFEVIAASTGEGALLDGDSISDYQNAPYALLDSVTPEKYRQISDDETDGLDSWDDDYARNVSLIGTDGKAMFFNVRNYARHGDNAERIPGVLPNVDSCFFQVAGSKQG